jgi:hypothetical protein
MLLSSGRFALKHAVAGGAVVLLAALFAGLAWLALFLWALAAGAPLGGPLAFPFMVGAAILAATLSAALLLFPVTAASELIRRRLRWPLLAEIPIATLLLGTVCLALSFVVGPALGVPRSRALGDAVIAMAALPLPLGLYWWSAQVTDAVLGLALRVCRASVGGLAAMSARRAGRARVSPSCVQSAR